MTDAFAPPGGGSIEAFDDLNSLYEAAAEAFCQLLRTAIDSRGVANICLSGGSTPRRLYEILAERDLPWSQIHWFWGDERNVTPDDAESNQKMVRDAMLRRAGAAEANIHAVVVQVDDPEPTARRYEQVLREHFAGDDFPAWDLALLGMGDDAHTASLFPGSDALSQSQRWFVENWIEKFDAFRYTVTAPAINSARKRWFLVAGSGKREAIRNVWSGPENPQAFPAQLIAPSRWWVTRDALPTDKDSSA